VVSTRDQGLPIAAWVAIAIVVVGALNWGLVGAFKFDLVAAIFGSFSVVSRAVYVAVALAGIYLLVVTTTRFRRDTAYTG